MKKLLTASLLLALVAGSANAAQTLTGTLFEVVITDAPLGNGLTAYTITANALGAIDPTTAVGLGTDGTETGLLAQGVLHQDQRTVLLEVSATQDKGTGNDTHWLVNSTDALVIAKSLSEPINDGASAVGTLFAPPFDTFATTGFSSYLQGGWAFSSSQGSSLPIAQIVLAGGEAQIDLQIAGAGRAENFSTVIPEPATMALLGLGAVALIRRRK